MRAWKCTASAITVREPISTDWNTGSTRLQPDEDLHGVIEVEIPRREFETNIEVFIEHTVIRVSKYMRKDRPRVSGEKITRAVVQRILVEGRPADNAAVNAQVHSIIAELRQNA
jgi:hypothetical protein